MSAILERIEADVMQIDQPERALLVERRLASLDAGADASNALDEEIEARVKAADSGSTQAIPEETVFQQVDERLRQF